MLWRAHVTLLLQLPHQCHWYCTDILPSTSTAHAFAAVPSRYPAPSHQSCRPEWNCSQARGGLQAVKCYNFKLNRPILSVWHSQHEDDHIFPKGAFTFLHNIFMFTTYPTFCWFEIIKLLGITLSPAVECYYLLVCKLPKCSSNSECSLCIKIFSDLCISSIMSLSDLNSPTIWPRSHHSKRNIKILKTDDKKRPSDPSSLPFEFFSF